LDQFVTSSSKVNLRQNSEGLYAEALAAFKGYSGKEAIEEDDFEDL
jgi:hypothetical protein